MCGSRNCRRRPSVRVQALADTVTGKCVPSAPGSAGGFYSWSSDRAGVDGEHGPPAEPGAEGTFDTFSPRLCRGILCIGAFGRVGTDSKNGPPAEPSSLYTCANNPQEEVGSRGGAPDAEEFWASLLFSASPRLRVTRFFSSFCPGLGGGKQSSLREKNQTENVSSEIVSKSRWLFFSLFHGSGATCV
jgi:hypothetical protein